MFVESAAETVELRTHAPNRWGRVVARRFLPFLVVFIFFVKPFAVLGRFGALVFLLVIFGLVNSFFPIEPGKPRFDVPFGNDT